MSLHSSSHLMRRIVAFRGSRQNRNQPLTDIASSVSPIGIQSEDVHLPMPEPFVTYHTNFLGLTTGDGETPIATTVPPKLTDMVPPMEDSFPAEGAGTSTQRSRAPRVIEDFDYVGGWVTDVDGKHQYVERGHIEEIEEEGDNLGPVAGPSHLSDALTLSMSMTPPPRPSLRTRQELPQSSPVQEAHHRFQHPRLVGIARTPTRFPSPLSHSGSGLPLLRGFSQQPGDTGHLFPEESQASPYHLPVSNNDAGALAESWSSLPPQGFPRQSDYIIAEHNTLPQPSSSGDVAMQFEHLADSLSSLPSLRGFKHFAPHTERISEEDNTSELHNPIFESTARAFESLGDSIESIPVRKEHSPPPLAQEPMPPVEVPSEPVTVPLYHSNGNDERTIEQIISSIKEISEMVKVVQLAVSSLGNVRNVQSHLTTCKHIEDSLLRVKQTLIRRRTLPREHWSHLSVSSRSRYESRLLSLQRCLRRLEDMSKRIVDPSRLDVLFKKLRQHHEKLTNVADKFEDTFERLRLRHLYTVASKLTEEANRNRSTYMSAREMYLHKRSRGKRSRASRPQTGTSSH